MFTDFPTSYQVALPPNAATPFTSAGGGYDVDYVSSRDGSSGTAVSYAAMTARSYHAGRVVNVVLMGGAVRVVNSAVAPAVWRGLGTRAGDEPPEDY